MGGTNDSSVPAVGALVRVISPKLGSDWRLGVFNRLRVEPPCYRVVIFQKNGVVHAGDILPLEDIERLQVHIIYDGETKSAPGSDAIKRWNDTEWREVSIKPLRELNQKQCLAKSQSVVDRGYSSGLTNGWCGRRETACRFL